MELKMFSLLWFTFVIGALVLTLIVYKIFINRSQWTKWFVGLLLSFLPLILYATMPFLDGTFNMENVIKHALADNLLAVLSILYPFIYIFANRFLKSTLVYVGLLLGIMCLVYPFEYLGDKFNIEMLMYILTVGFMAINSFLSVAFGIFKMKWYDFFIVPFSLLTLYATIVLLQFIGVKAGIYDVDNLSNISWQYGVNYFGGKLDFIKPIMDFFINRFTFAATLNFPVIWFILPFMMIVPAVTAAVYIICLLFSLIHKILTPKVQTRRVTIDGVEL